MNAFLDLTAFLCIWTFIYFVSEDVVKFLAKHFIFITALTAVYMGIGIYGQQPLGLILVLLLALWLITIVIDSLDYFVKKPLQTVIGKTGHDTGRFR